MVAAFGSKTIDAEEREATMAVDDMLCTFIREVSTEAASSSDWEPSMGPRMKREYKFCRAASLFADTIKFDDVLPFTGLLSESSNGLRFEIIPVDVRLI